MNEPTPCPAEPPINDPPTPPWFHFGEKAVACVRQLTAEEVNVLPNGQIASIAFTGLLAELQGSEAPLNATTVIALEVPGEVLSNDPFLGYYADLRGTCSKSAGARAVLIAQFGGATHTQVFPYDAEMDGGWFARVFSFEARPNKDSGQPVVSLPPFTINVMISVQRRSVEDSVELALETIDLTADRT